jgi:hypothetical protein
MAIPEYDRHQNGFGGSSPAPSEDQVLVEGLEIPQEGARFGPGVIQNLSHEEK